MAEWVTIEHIAFRGGHRDGEQLKDVGSAGLVTVISLQTQAGADCSYRKAGDYRQLRRTHG